MNSKRLIILPVLASLAAIPVSHAGNQEYNECILTHVTKAKVDVAATFIKQACEENYRTPSFTFSKRKIYNECILSKLPGIESAHAAIEVRNICAASEF